MSKKRSKRVEVSVGDKNNHLTVLKEVGKSIHGNRRVLCRCECGCETIIDFSKFRSGNTKSCGCLVRDSAFRSIKDNSWLNKKPKEREIIQKKQVEARAKKYLKEGTNIKNLTMSIARNNTSGIKGVSWDKSHRKWVAYIYFQKKRIHLGRFENKVDAINARKEAEEKYFNPVLRKHEKEVKQEEK